MKIYQKKGIIFRDLLPTLRNPEIFQDLVKEMSNNDTLINSDAIIAIEARGFIFGAVISFHISNPLVIARNPGKLP